MCTAKILALFGLFLATFDNIHLTKAGGIEDECTSNADCTIMNSVCDVDTSTCICLPGYNYTGNQCRQCQTKHDCLDLNYSDDVKCFKFVCECKDGTTDCFPRCPDLTAPLNGTVTYDPDTSVGSIATFSCDSGFDPPTNPTRTCLMGGSWDDDTIPCCTQSCNCSTTPSCSCGVGCPYADYELMCGCTCFSDEFVTVPGKVIGGYNILSQIVSGADECKELCVNTPGCVNCELDKTNSNCWLNYVPPYIVEWSWENSTIYDFYYRKCFCGN